MKKRIWILTLFPEYFRPLLDCGVAGSALRGERCEEGSGFSVHCVNIRDFTKTKYKSVDDSPFGGGPGMVMRPDILEAALLSGVRDAGGYRSLEELQVIYTSPRGRPWDNRCARDFAMGPLSSDPRDLVFICGRYEGIDERFLELYVDDFVSLGDYVLTGGELAVMVILDSAIRFVPGILGNKLSSVDDSFEDGLLEFPQYTKPRKFQGLEVPPVLLEGHHKKIAEWQKTAKLQMTQKHRPDLL